MCSCNHSEADFEIERLRAKVVELTHMIKVRNTLVIDKNQQITNLEKLWTACKEQVDVEDRYVHDLTPIIEAMDLLEAQDELG